MISKSLGIYGVISAAAIVSGILAGCGSSNTVQGISPTVSSTGGLATAPGSGPAGGVDSSPAPQQVQVTVNGTQETATLPANETIQPGANVNVLPSTEGTPIFTGLQYGSGAAKHATKVTGPTGKPMTTGAQGEIDVDGVNTGVTVTSGGWLSGPLILVQGQHTLTAWGPFSIVGGSAFNPTQLDISSYFQFGITIDSDGNGSIPTNLAMQLPADGGAIKNGHYVVVTYPTPDFASGSGTLAINWPGGGVQQNKPVVNGVATFRAFTNPAIIPSSGVGTVVFTYIP